ncbi:MAG TPA: ATP-binding cassette domain-containing protein [Candidatus Dormibacteraeota bacterium]|nr:ATP-binding cassette domain-containing protein [Candidatus Dormibacteraeota bacterium]
MINVQNLSKAFGPKLAVNNISFRVERGEVLGFLGPNGAGKSTTMRMITGFIPPSDGTITVGGFDITRDPLAAKSHLGYLPEAAPVYADMSVRSFLLFCAELSGLRGLERKKALHRVVEMCFLEPVLQQSVDTLSKGYRHRTCLAQALIHDPDVLVLDEPTDGLDPNQKHEIRQLIRHMGERKAIIFSTHILEEVEAACTRAIIIDRGRIVASGTPQELKNLSELGGAIVVAVRGPSGAQLTEKLSRMPNTRKTAIIKEEQGEVWARVFPEQGARNGDMVRNVIQAANGWKVEEIRTEEGRLDEVFRTITLPDTKATFDK